MKNIGAMQLVTPLKNVSQVVTSHKIYHSLFRHLIHHVIPFLDRGL